MEEDKLKEDINRIIKCGIIYTLEYDDKKALINILNELKRLQKEFEAVDHECSRLEKKEIELEKENKNLREHNHNLIEQNRKDKEFLLDRLDKLENALNSKKQCILVYIVEMIHHYIVKNANKS